MSAKARSSGLASFQQDELRSRISSLLGTHELKAFRNLDIPHTLFDTCVIYLLLAAAIGATCALHAGFGSFALLGAPILACVTGIAFNWINVQVHEASHNLLFPDRSFNDLYCNLFLGSLALQDVQTYRATHGMHHSYLHADKDPDLWIYASQVGSRREVLRGILDDLLLTTIRRRRRQVSDFLRKHERRQELAPRYTLLAKFAAQAAVLALFIAGCGAQGVLYYGSVYLYGLVGVFPALVRIRTVVQHYGFELKSEPDPAAIPFISRSTVAPFLEFLVVGARMDYHFEHHLYPNIPYYNLRSMHRTLQDAQLFEAIRANTGQELHTNDYLRSFAKFAMADQAPNLRSPG